jgi:hypothetical protein
MHCKYLKSQVRHHWFVFVECCKLGIPWLGIVHDLSKFSPSEWRGYARYFYGGYPDEDAMGVWGWTYYTGPTKQSVAHDFDVAWLHHQHRNKHHWQRWLLTLDSARGDGKLFPLPMPDRYRREMLADWRGAGRAYGNSNTAEWYRQNREQIQLHPETRQWIEKQLGIVLAEPFPF